LAAFLYLSNLPDPEFLEVERHIKAAPSRAFCQKSRPPMVCAHGGDSSDAPPNTADSFRAAIDAGADCVEIDAARTRDGHLVVLHVRELQHLLHMRDNAKSSKQGKSAPKGSSQENPHTAHIQVGDLTLQELQELQWQPGGQHLLTVQEAVSLVSPFVATVTLDVKTYQDSSGEPTDEEMIADQLVQLVHATSCSNCLIWAKSDAVVRRIKSMSPGQKAGYIVMNETDSARKAGMHLPLRMEDPEVVGMHFAMVDAYHLSLLHGAGKELHTWTINDMALMHRVLDVGVDAIVTNFPKLAIEAVESRIVQCGGALAQQLSVSREEVTPEGRRGVTRMTRAQRHVAERTIVLS